MVCAVGLELSITVTWKENGPNWAGAVPQKVAGVPHTPLPVRSKVNQVGNVGAVVFADQL